MSSFQGQKYKPFFGTEQSVLNTEVFFLQGHLIRRVPLHLLLSCGRTKQMIVSFSLQAISGAERVTTYLISCYYISHTPGFLLLWNIFGVVQQSVGKDNFMYNTCTCSTYHALCCRHSGKCRSHQPLVLLVGDLIYHQPVGS